MGNVTYENQSQEKDQTKKKNHILDVLASMCCRAEMGRMPPLPPSPPPHPHRTSQLSNQHPGATAMCPDSRVCHPCSISFQKYLPLQDQFF